MDPVIKSPKTMIMGVLMIVAAVAHSGFLLYSGHPLDTEVLFVAVSGGLGLIMAKDATTHSTPEQVQLAGQVAKVEAKVEAQAKGK
jgi:hypothetical protein